MKRTLAALALVGAVLALAACDPNGSNSTPAPTTSTVVSAAPTSTKDDEAAAVAKHQDEVEQKLTAMGFKVVPGSVQLIGNAAMYMIGNLKLDLGCTVADGVGFQVDTREEPYTVKAEVRTTSHNSDGSSQDTDKTYVITAQPTPKQIEAYGLCAAK